jgi:hypothetical protein
MPAPGVSDPTGGDPLLVGLERAVQLAGEPAPALGVHGGGELVGLGVVVQAGGHVRVELLGPGRVERDHLRELHDVGGDDLGAGAAQVAVGLEAEPAGGAPGALGALDHAEHPTFGRQPAAGGGRAGCAADLEAAGGSAVLERCRRGGLRDHRLRGRRLGDGGRRSGIEQQVDRGPGPPAWVGRGRRRRRTAGRRTRATNARGEQRMGAFRGVGAREGGAEGARGGPECDRSGGGRQRAPPGGSAQWGERRGTSSLETRK